MKLLRYGELGKERPGVLDKDGKIRDLSGHVEDISGSILGTNSINKLKEINVENLPTVDGTPRLGTCVSGIGKFMCCLLYTSPSPRDRTRSRMPSSA